MNDLELIKSKIDIVTFLSDYIQLKKAGRNFKALCPFHSEKTPSFVVSPERQTWHCFGACNIGGDIFDFLVKWENLEFVESIKILAKKAGVTISSYQPSEELKIKEKLYEINHLASEYFHFLLTRHPLGKYALDYVKGRGLNDKIIDTFSLGYSPNSWEAMLKFLQKKNYSIPDIITSGLAVKTDRGRIYDRFRGRLMFTLKDHRGNPIGFSGRKILDDEKEAKYINTPETPVYIKGNVLYGLDITYESIRKKNEAIVVEGEFDFLSSYECGVDNIVAIKGSAFTENQVNLLKRYTENVTLSLDSDFAGNQAAKKGIEVAENAGLFLKVVSLPYGKDPHECIKKDPHLWKKAVKDTTNIYDFLFTKALKQYDNNTPVGKKEIGDEIIPFISKISNPIIMSHYIKKIARSLDVSEESIDSLIEKSKRKYSSSDKPILSDTKKLTREELIEEHLLYLTLHAEDTLQILNELSKILDISDFSTSSVSLIFDQLQKFSKTHKKLDISLFTKSLPQEVLPTFDKAYLREFSIKDNILFAKDVKKTALSLKQLSLRRRINRLTTKMKKTDIEGDEGSANSLTLEVKNLISQLNNLEKMTI